MLYKAPRGTTDILPEEQIYWTYVQDKAASLCCLYGYQPIDTPVFEDQKLFARSSSHGTDLAEKEMYVFEDRGGQLLALKAEGTAPVCRAYLEHGLFNLAQPVRLYYLSAIFRYERPQAGRYRQHHQFGFEAIGDADPVLDAEVIELAQHFLLSLGLSGFSLQLNSIGCRQCRPAYIRALLSHYAGHAQKLCPDCQTRREKNPLRLLDCKNATCQEIADSAPAIRKYLCAECQEHFQKVQQYLEILDIPFQLNNKLVRGLDYYTRTVFEFQPEEEGAQKTIGGGGRYDDLIEALGGKPTPAVGFAAGIERIILNLKTQNISLPSPPAATVFLIHIGGKAKLETVKLAATLRQAGIATISAVGDRSLKSQLRQAHNRGFPTVIIVGEEEIDAQQAILRDMSTGTQQNIPFGEIVSAVTTSCG